MAKEICISSTPHETRLAILEDDQLAEIYYERENEYTLAGSIYNGRVTRVLPGMQSAFVDVGLERDAFLYVTDFLEMEDPEDSDELEKATTSGGSRPPREVRPGSNLEGGTPEAAPERTQDRGPERNQERSPERSQDRGPERNRDRNQDRGNRGAERQDQKPDQKQDRRGDQRPGRGDRRPAAPLTVEAVEIAPSVPAQLPVIEQESATDESGEPRRWRGRRRRRSGRGGAGSTEGQPGSEEAGEPRTESALEFEPEEAPVIHASAAPSQPAVEPAVAKFVLPGESLSKYGGVPQTAEGKAGGESSAPVRPASTFKPQTLIESPIEWDGSGLLPGESLSKHRNRPAEPAVEVDDEPHGVFSDAVTTPPEAVQEAIQDEADEDDFEEETVQAPPLPEAVTEPAPEEPDVASQPEEYAVETLFETPSADEQVAPAVSSQAEDLSEAVEAAPEHADPADAVHEVHAHAAEPNTGVHAGNEAETEAVADSDEPVADASASHHIDPLPPTSFRLFGLGGRKKKTDEPAPESETAIPVAEPVQATVTRVSAYAPGVGLVEEEVIEEEEFDGSSHHHHAKSDEHDLDDFEEEETLQTQIRSGDLGELLQEAHLDHRIQLNFDDKNGDEEIDDEDEDEDEEEAEAEGQSAPAEGQAQNQQRRDRGGRGRRGRGGAPAQGGQGNRRGGPSRRSAQTSDLPIISDLLKPGQEILVQIAKEPIAKKGARITSHIALPGRFLVFMPTVSHVGVSRKINSDEERQRLKRILVHERGEASGGFIVRTAAEGASEEELRSDLRFLIHLWDEIRQRSESSKSPALIYHDLSLIERILRDQVSSNFSSIWVDSEQDYERIVRFLNRFSPTLVRRVKLYTKEVPLFEHFGIQDEISKALRSKVWLKSGGSIVINQTEALVAIDINTGKYVGKSARLEDTILKTNLDAVPEIVRQVRLRDLGGIIVIDFIDMDERKNRYKVMAALEEALKSDRAPTKVLQFNDFGLVAITRKRVKQSLERTLSVPCPTCQATGMVKSPTTVCNEIYTELRKMRKHFESADVLLRVNPETVKVLKANNASWLTEFEELVGKNILVKSDATLHPEQFDIQG